MDLHSIPLSHCTRPASHESAYPRNRRIMVEHTHLQLDYANNVLGLREAAAGK